MEGGFIFICSQNIKGIRIDRPGIMTPFLFWGPENNGGGFILELGLISNPFGVHRSRPNATFFDASRCVPDFIQLSGPFTFGGNIHDFNRASK